MKKANTEKQQKEKRVSQKIKGVAKPKKLKKAVKKVLKEKLSTTSNDSNQNGVNLNELSNFEKPLLNKKPFEEKEEEDSQANGHFFLRKRKKINYSLTRPDFVYESISDSDYDDTKSKRNKRRKNGVKKERKDKVFKKNMPPALCREFQLKSLLNWKNYPKEPVNSEKEYQLHIVDDLVNCNLEKYSKDLECILINPPWSSKTPKFDFAKFNKIKLPFKCMKEGLIFIWVERDLMSEVIDFFEDKGIKYVENLIWIKLNPKNQSNAVSQNPANMFDINDLYTDEQYEYFSKSKMTLLIFRKFKPNNERNLELRHQRTGDAVFDFVDSNLPYHRPYDYIYRLIEILLPKANYNEKSDCLKLMEIWAAKNSKRKGWIHIVQK